MTFALAHPTSSEPPPMEECPTTEKIPLALGKYQSRGEDPPFELHSADEPPQTPQDSKMMQNVSHRYATFTI